jgi:hypothetical protein
VVILRTRDGFYEEKHLNIVTHDTYMRESKKQKDDESNGQRTTCVFFVLNTHTHAHRFDAERYRTIDSLVVSIVKDALTYECARARLILKFKYECTEHTPHVGRRRLFPILDKLVVHPNEESKHKKW